MSMTIDLDDIPGPKGRPIVGNALDIDAENPIETFLDMARDYGPIFKISVPTGTRIFVSGPDLVEEVCDDARFDKMVGGGLANLRRGPTGNGLFTSDTDDPLWRRAHNILMAPFSVQAMRDYMPRMLDIADQLMGKWERLNPDDEVDVPADMTRLTLDTIALCGFGYRFNSFYRETPHPFVQAMVRTLEESQRRMRQLPIQTRLRIRAQRQSEEDDAFMNALVDQLIAERRAQGEDADTTDLLGRMLSGVDKSGEGLPDENIRAQCITFLVAGHETTSGLLSFALYYLLKNPDILARARDEVDDVLGGTAAPTFEQVHRLTYVRQVLDESLRLWPTAAMFTRRPLEDTVIGDRYALPANTAVTVLVPALHRDRSIWGDDAQEFHPEHMAPERLASMPSDAYKPFGTGQRACIGRQFALQEAALVLGMLLQRFEFVDHRDYQLRIQTTLTVKPADFHIRVRPRPGVHIDRAGTSDASRADAASAGTGTALAPSLLVPRHGTRLSVLFGSNLGTAESIATRVAHEGTERGFDVTVGPLDEHVGDLPDGGATVIVTASYNGAPPDNATAFCEWLRSAAPDAAKGVKYTVFGCGNTEWHSTYQAVPTLVDGELEAHGAVRVHARGEGNAAGDFDADYRAWHSALWADLATALDLPPAVASAAPAEARLSITLTNRQVTNPVIVSYSAHPAVVRENRELIPVDGSPRERSVRHLEIALPAATTYQTGDHLGVLPRNSYENIRRVMARFGLDAGQWITIIPNSGTHTHLPIDEPTPVLGVLGCCVELQDTASRDALSVLARHTKDPAQRADLEGMVGDDEESAARYRERVHAPHLSVLDVLDQFPSCALPFEEYLDLLPPLRPRFYSISSSPLASDGQCSITAQLLQAPARSGAGAYRGVCSGYLAQTPVNGTLFVFVKHPAIPFRPPESPQTPMIMVGAGTGLAPFRGFIQDRAALQGQGVPIGPSLFFFGCRNSQNDLLYPEELAEYVERGVARVERCYSDEPGTPRRFVQDAMLECADEVWDLMHRDARVLVCGNAATIAPGVRASLAAIFRKRTGASEADADAWISGLRSSERLVEDIWA